ncbi:MAG: histidinol-phosphate transaminase [Gammaproteobacteria bacterium]|nr:histidinol-phosphate transaminase [Gammaproteobacteria bacterium]
MSRFWSRDIAELNPYTPGEQPQMDGLVKLNTNENPYGPSPLAIEAIKRAADDNLRKYPDPSAAALKQAVANHHALNTDQVFVGNSSDEVLAHVFKALLRHEQALLMPDISYSFYPVWCEYFGIDFRSVPLREDFSLAVEDYSGANGGIIFANPNAPTGMAISNQQIAHLLNQHPDSVVVVDEAYADFSGQSAVSLINKHANLLVVQTLSKARSLAGLRVGLALGQAHLIEGLERVKNSFHPYPLDRLAIAGAVAAYQDQAWFDSTIEKVVATRETAVTQLNQMGFEVLPSAANFVMVRHGSAAAADLFSKLREHKIVVRYFSAPRLDQWLRISIGSDAEMAALFEALEEILTA